MKTTIYTPKFLFLALLAITTAISSCSRDKDPIPVIPPSDGTNMTLNGGEGGSSAENTVFVDLSTDTQTDVKRTSWDLGFYNGDQFHVVLNNTAGASAIEVNNTDLKAVSESDINLDDLAIGLGEAGAFDNIDNLTGDLTKTLIPGISATEGDNKIYVINTIGGSHGAAITADHLYKIRIVRSGDDYKLEYATLNSTEVKTLTIKKDKDYNFNYVSLTTGPIKIEPKKADWDFQWTWSLYFGGGNTPDDANSYPYGYSDLIFINYLGGTSAVEIVEGNSDGKPSYADFSESDLAGISFNNSKGVIGANWRVTPSPSPGVVAGTKKDRFYLIKDDAGNIYKVKFNSFTPEDAGKRGYPELEYKLVKQG